MKKIIKILIVVLASVCIVCFGGCSLFSCNDNESGDTNNTTYAFSIQYEDELTKYSFDSAGSIKISPRYKSGYILDGFYTLPDGGGTKMLDENGKCLSSSFSGDGSTVLYPKYSPI